jgi:GNAT superfamily N-acetyltransferase
VRGTIRPAARDDAPAIARIVRDAYSRWTARLGRESSPVDWDYAELIAGSGWAVWVLETDRGIVGVLVLEETSGSMLVHNLAVGPEAQGMGYGRRLLRFAEEEARRPGGAELYEHVGFRAVERLEGDDPSRAYVLMAKALL